VRPRQWNNDHEVRERSFKSGIYSATVVNSPILMPRIITQCGYLIDQDYMKTFFMKEEEGEDGEEYDSYSLIGDLCDWWYDLPKDIRAQMPLVQSSWSRAITTSQTCHY
jgi:hypothetical protein